MRHTATITIITDTESPRMRMMAIFDPPIMPKQDGTVLTVGEASETNCLVRTVHVIGQILANESHSDVPYHVPGFEKERPN